MKEACPLLSPGNCNSFSWPAPFLACSSCLLLSARYPTLLHRMQVWLHWIKSSFPTTNIAPEGCFPAKERHRPESNPQSPIQTTVEWNQYVENSGFLHESTTQGMKARPLKMEKTESQEPEWGTAIGKHVLPLLHSVSWPLSLHLDSLWET